MTDRGFRFATDDEDAREHELIEALDRHQSVGERYARSGAIPASAQRDPSIRPSANADMTRDATPVQPLPRPPRFVGRRILQVLLVVVIALVTYFGVSLWQVHSTGRSDQARPVDAIVVMGAAQYDGRPSPQLAARLDHVVELWPQQLAPRVIVTGGKRPGDRFTEASASARYLIEQGIPESAIIQEGTGTSTFESLEQVHRLVGDTVNDVLIVTDPYHALRSRLIAQEVGFTAYVSPTRDSVVTGSRELRRELGEAGGVAIGRVISFDRLSGLTD